MIIRTGDARIQVDSLDAGIAAVRALASRLGGYVAYSSITAGNEQTHSATMWRNFVSFVAGFIAPLGYLVPLVVVLGAFMYGLVTISRRMKRPVPGGVGKTESEVVGSG